MRSAVLHPGRLELDVVETVTAGPPRAGEVRVRVLHSGICHSDLTVIDNGVHEPVVLGHEAAGIVEDVGEGVDHLREGDPVILAPLAPCGDCGACARGAGTECHDALAFVHHRRPDGTSPFAEGDDVVGRGLGVGGFAEYTVVSASGAVKVPEDTPLDIACVIGCAVQTGVGAVLNTAAVEPGSTVLVFGAGGVGQAIVQGARIAGAERVVVSEPNAQRRADAERLGATDAVDPAAVDLRDLVMGATGGHGVDYAFDAAGSAALIELGLDLCRVGGTTVMVGAPPLDEAVTISAAVFFLTMQKKLVGSVLGGCWPERDIPQLIGHWREGRLDLGGLVSHRLDLADINEGVRLLRDGDGIRTVLDVAPTP